MHRFVFSMHHGKINKISNQVPEWAMQMYAAPIAAYYEKKDAIIAAAVKSLHLDDSIENKKRVLKILLEAGMPNDDIQSIYAEHAGIPNI